MQSQIAQGFISSAPPGQVNIVLQGKLHILIKDLVSLLGETDYSEMIRDYHINANSIFESLILTKHGQRNEFSFDDPNAHKILEIDPVTLSLVNSTTYEFDQDIEKSRLQVQEDANKYINSHYSNGIATVYGGPNEYLIYFSAEKYNPDNFWNGKWVSEWKVSLDQEKAILNGNIKVHVHYFEDGNVQLKQEKNVSLSIEMYDGIVKKLFKSIQQAEHEIHKNLIKSCSLLCEASFKGLRRALPLTKAKMDWVAIGNYKIGSELEKS